MKKNCKISRLDHPLVKHLVKLRKERTYRDQCQSVLIMGEKMVEEIGKIASPINLLTTQSRQNGCTVTEEILKKITGLKHPEPIVAEVAMPKLPLPKKVERLLILDGVSDPGNLGTLIRSALAFSWDALFLLVGSVDPFNDKALRAAKGATFLLPMIHGTIQELKTLIKQHHLHCFAATLGGEEGVEFSAPLALILGSESHGVSKELLSLARSVTLPQSSKVDSLNVASAGAIFLYLMRGANG